MISETPGPVPLRLVFLSTSEGWGGLEMNLLRHARWMSQAGHHSRVLCLENSPLHRAALAYLNEKAEDESFDLRTIRKGWRYLALATAIHRATRLIRHRADWLWVRDPRDLDTSAWARRIVGWLRGPPSWFFTKACKSLGPSVRSITACGLVRLMLGSVPSLGSKHRCVTTRP